MLKAILLLLLPLSVAAQFDLSKDFTTTMDSLDVRVNHPLHAEYKSVEPSINPYLAEQSRLYCRQERMEIRFASVPETEEDHFYQMPHVRAGHLLANLSSNDEDAVTTVLSLDEEEMATLNADWARVFIFKPKASFSDRRTGQLVASYKQGRGLLYTILLFNKPPSTLLGRQLALRWK